MGLAARTMGLVAHTIGLASLLEDGLAFGISGNAQGSGSMLVRFLATLYMIISLYSWNLKTYCLK
jgi:lipoprotein signal peptidase